MEDGGGHGMVLGGMVAEAVPVITEEAIVVTGGDMQTVVMDGDDTAAEVVAVADTVGDLAVVVDIMEARVAVQAAVPVDVITKIDLQQLI